MKKIISIAFIVLMGLLIGAPALAYDTLGGACDSANNASATCAEKNAQGASGTNPVSGSSGVLHTAATIIAVLTGIIAVIMIVISGIRYMTSGGNPEKTKRAKANLISAIIGLAVVVLAWAIITFAVNHVQ